MSGLWKKCAGTALAVAVGSCMPGAQTAPITLSVDLTDAPRKILHATEVMPVTRGPAHRRLSQVDSRRARPDWSHRKHGRLLHHRQRPAREVGARQGRHVRLPPDGPPGRDNSLEMKIDFLASSSLSGFSAGGSTSENLALLSWNTLLVYPAGTNASDVMFTPSITIPAGWKFGTALDKDGGYGPTHHLQNRKPRAARRFARARWPLLPRSRRSPPRLRRSTTSTWPPTVRKRSSISKEHIAEFDRLVRETGALYKSRHYGVVSLPRHAERRSRALRPRASSIERRPRRPQYLHRRPGVHPRPACCCRTSSPIAGTASTAVPRASPPATTRSRWRAICSGSMKA